MKTFLTELAQEPRACLTQALTKQKFYPAMTGYAVGIISLYLAIKLTIQSSSVSLLGLLFTFIFGLLLNLILNFVLASFANLFFEFMDDKTKAVELFILLGISQLFLSLLVPWCLIAKSVEQIAQLTPLAFIAVFFLQIYFVLSYTKKVYGVSRISALLAFGGALILPFVLLFCFVACITMLFIA